MSAEAKKNTEYVTPLEGRVIKVETRTEEQFKFMCKRLDSIEGSLNDLTKTVQSVRDYLSEQKGGLNAKTKMWFVFYSFVTIITALGLHTFAYKLFGWNI